MVPLQLFREVRLKLDHGCNFRCFYCSSWQRREPQLDVSAVCNLLRGLASHGARKLSISGGEPLTYPEFERILSDVGALFQRVSVTTNGTGLARLAGEKARLNGSKVTLST